MVECLPNMLRVQYPVLEETKEGQREREEEKKRRAQSRRVGANLKSQHSRASGKETESSRPVWELNEVLSPNTKGKSRGGSCGPHKAVLGPPGCGCSLLPHFHSESSVSAGDARAPSLSIQSRSQTSKSRGTAWCRPWNLSPRDLGIFAAIILREPPTFHLI